MALVQVEHRRLERLLRIGRTIEAQLSLCAVLMRWAQDTGDTTLYTARKSETIRLETQRVIYNYLIGCEWDRINGVTGVGEAIRVAFRG
jgi:hypothetical protein